MADRKNKLDPAKILDDALNMQGVVAPYYSCFGDPYSITNMAYLYQQGAREIVGLKRHWLMSAARRFLMPGVIATVSGCRGLDRC